MLIALCLAACTVAGAPAPPAGARRPNERWTPEQARRWQARVGRTVGCNYVPSTAVNDIEMWRKATFDPATIDRELAWARDLGLNSVRVFLNFVVWREDAAGLKARFRQFLDLAARHGVSVMPILFDDCNFAGRVAAAGPQPGPVPGVHNSQWVSSPPLTMVTDPSVWPDLQRYVADMVGAFARDDRIVVWDLYNEPGNSGMGERSLPLAEAVFGWARQARPRQPLTMGLWADFNDPMSHRLMELSDVVSFHGYDAPDGIEAKIDLCEGAGRPVLCTEWLHRQSGNDFRSLLPILLRRNVACWHWGLVAGRTQTYCHWGSLPGSPMPAQWQHDVLHADGKPYDAEETEFIRRTLAPPK